MSPRQLKALHEVQLLLIGGTHARLEFRRELYWGKAGHRAPSLLACTVAKSYKSGVSRCRGGLPRSAGSFHMWPGPQVSVPTAGLWEPGHSAQLCFFRSPLLLSASQYPILNPFCFKHSCTVWDMWDAVMRYSFKHLPVASLI